MSFIVDFHAYLLCTNIQTIPYSFWNSCRQCQHKNDYVFALSSSSPASPPAATSAASRSSSTRWPWTSQRWTSVTSWTFSRTAFHPRRRSRGRGARSLRRSRRWPWSTGAWTSCRWGISPLDYADSMSTYRFTIFACLHRNKIARSVRRHIF